MGSGDVATCSPLPMNFEIVEDIKQSGFEGFKAISTLKTLGCWEVPEEGGVYLVLRLNTKRPDFPSKSIGGHFKGRDPTVEVSVLEGKWVRGALVLYVGKAGGPGKLATLRSRLINLMRFGQGKRVGKFGGRYIWQLRDSGDLLLCWKLTPNAVPRDVEKDLIREFEVVYKKLPFANLIH